MPFSIRLILAGLHSLLVGDAGLCRRAQTRSWQIIQLDERQGHGHGTRIGDMRLAWSWPIRG